MLAKMIDKIVALKETKTFEIAGQTYADAPLTRIPPHVDRPDCISVSGLDGICKLIRTELAKINTVIMVQAKSYKSVEVMTTYLPDFSRNILYRAEADVPGLRTGFRSREVALIELRSLFIPNEGAVPAPRILCAVRPGPRGRGRETSLRSDHIPGRRQHADRLHLGRGADQRRA